MATVRAPTLAVIYEVGQAAMAKLMQDRPSIVDGISVTLSLRAKVSTVGIGDGGEAAPPRSVGWMVARIREEFETPH